MDRIPRPVAVLATISLSAKGSRQSSESKIHGASGISHLGALKLQFGRRRIVYKSDSVDKSYAL
jgi:hypothetical protein